MNPHIYKQRRVQSFDFVEANGRSIKLYGIFSAQNEDVVYPSAEVVRNTLIRLSASESSSEDHPAGFAILHFADDGIYLLLSHWFDANMLKHQVYQCKVFDSYIDITTDLADKKIIACIWEIEVIKFERDAWIESVLQTGRIDQGTIDAYLATTFSGWV